MGDFLMPSLGADMEAGRVVEWRVAPGDAVRRGDVVAVVDTEKADIEVEVFEDGVVEEVLVPVGERVPVGTPLARLGPAAAPGAAGAPRRATPAATPAAARAAAPPAPPAAPHPSPPSPPAAPHPSPPSPPAAPHPSPPSAPRLPATGGRRVSPRARRLAADLGVDLDAVSGTGPGGAVQGDDVVAAAGVPGATPRPPAGPPPPPRVAWRSGEGAAPAPEPRATAVATEVADREAAMRAAIARRMERSKREIPHYYLGTAIDFGRARAWLDAENDRRGVADRLLPAVLLLRATVLAVRAVPEVNGVWRDGAFAGCDSVHLGVAVSLRTGGLVAPTVRDAQDKGLDELMHELRDVVARARRGVLRSSDVSDPTLTVTNLGDQGVDAVYGVIFPPQVALVGFGAVRERPWAADGQVVVRPVVQATLSADHRVSDGARGARFLSSIDRQLQEPDAL